MIAHARKAKSRDPDRAVQLAHHSLVELQPRGETRLPRLKHLGAHPSSRRAAMSLAAQAKQLPAALQPQRCEGWAAGRRCKPHMVYSYVSLPSPSAAFAGVPYGCSSMVAPRHGEPRSAQPRRLPPPLLQLAAAASLGMLACLNHASNWPPFHSRADCRLRGGSSGWRPVRSWRHRRPHLLRLIGTRWALVSPVSARCALAHLTV